MRTEMLPTCAMIAMQKLGVIELSRRRVDEIVVEQKDVRGLLLSKYALCLGIEPSFRAAIRMTGACTNRYTNRDIALSNPKNDITNTRLLHAKTHFIHPNKHLNQCSGSSCYDASPKVPPSLFKSKQCNQFQIYPKYSPAFLF
jgi:hypothetical protein